MPTDDMRTWWQLHLQNLISQAVGFGGAVWVAHRLWNGGGFLWACRDPPLGAVRCPGARHCRHRGLQPIARRELRMERTLIPEGSTMEALFLPMEQMIEALTTFLATAEGSRRVIILRRGRPASHLRRTRLPRCLQPLLIRATGSAFWGIALASIIFSAIHFQFYGFLPRVCSAPCSDGSLTAVAACCPAWSPTSSTMRWPQSPCGSPAAWPMT